MSIWTRTRTAMAATCLAFAAIPGTIVLIHTPGVANADVCASVGRRVSANDTNVGPRPSVGWAPCCLKDERA